MSLFRIVGSLASSAYSFFVLKYAQTHMQAILLGASLLYFVAFMVMCFTVKEGEYPPPPELIGNKKGLIAQIKTYFVESFHTQVLLVFLPYEYVLLRCLRYGSVWPSLLAVTWIEFGHYRESRRDFRYCFYAAAVSGRNYIGQVSCAPNYDGLLW